MELYNYKTSPMNTKLLNYQPPHTEVISLEMRKILCDSEKLFYVTPEIPLGDSEEQLF